MQLTFPHRPKWTCTLIALCAFLLPPLTNACTRVLINDPDHAVMVGRTMDWYEDMNTDLIFYPRQLNRVGHAPGDMKEDNWITWTSKYANVVATGYEDLANDGLNEMGFAAHVLWLEHSNYGERDHSKLALSQTVWMQYYLDNFKSVAEAVAFTEANTIQVIPFFHQGTQQWGKLHLVLEDATGDSAIIEYTKGQVKIYHDTRYVVATNEPTFDKQLQNVKNYQAFGGTLPLPGADQSKERFVRGMYYAKVLLKPTSLQNELAGVLSIMNNVAHPYAADERTLWHSVSDLTNKIYYFQSKENQQLLSVNFSRLDFNAKASTKCRLSQHPEYSGEVSSKFE